MILRNHSVQWIFITIVFFTLLYLKLKVTSLEENNKLLHEAVMEINSENKKEIISHTQMYSKLSELDDTIVIYNRVPKTGSTSFVGVVYDLCKSNKFHTLHLNVTNNMHTLTLANQIKFIHNITEWTVLKPSFYHGHIAFLNFEKFGVQHVPIYVNLLRKPLDRFISYYYFLRYGDNFRPHLIRKKHGDRKSFDECVQLQQADCDPNNMWIQIPFLCGHDPACWEVGNKWALDEAKRNIQRHYLLVGVTEELEDFIQILELILPRFFKGGHDIFLHNNKSHLRQTTQKLEPQPETVERIKKSIVWKMENDLYNFALAYFHNIKKRLLNASVQDANQQFMYEKIRPK